MCVPPPQFSSGRVFTHPPPTWALQLELVTRYCFRFPVRVDLQGVDASFKVKLYTVTVRVDEVSLLLAQRIYEFPDPKTLLHFGVLDTVKLQDCVYVQEKGDFSKFSSDYLRMLHVVGPYVKRLLLEAIA